MKLDWPTILTDRFRTDSGALAVEVISVIMYRH